MVEDATEQLPEEAAHKISADDFKGAEGAVGYEKIWAANFQMVEDTTEQLPEETAYKINEGDFKGAEDTVGCEKI